jgi:hypothetical protein
MTYGLIPVKNATGGEVLPVTDGFYQTPPLSGYGPVCRCYVEFYSDANGTIPVKPGAGTVTPSVKATPNVWLPFATNPTIDASKVDPSPATATYGAPETRTGCAFAFRVKFESIAGAVSARAWFTKSDA